MTRIDKGVEVARVAVIVPCRDEELTVGKVIDDVRRALPTATVYVYDNASTDATAAAARAHGAEVRSETRPGKGNAVRRAFADVDADVYVLIDGDATYEAARLPDLVALLLEARLDHVNGARQPEEGMRDRAGHRLGNRLLSGTVSLLFGSRIEDMLSGFKVLSRRFVRSFPATSTGFEIETELTIHALQLAVPLAEVPVGYSERPEDSFSKLRTYRDGWRILRTIARLVIRERPLAVYGAASLVLAITSGALGIPVVVEFAASGQVPRFPTAILAAGLGTVAVLGLSTGLVLDAVRHGRHEAKRLAYLAFPPSV
jgi:glycosyltransferase involved in cell wall biosynthesis